MTDNTDLATEPSCILDERLRTLAIISCKVFNLDLMPTFGPDRTYLDIGATRITLEYVPHRGRPHYDVYRLGQDEAPYWLASVDTEHPLAALSAAMCHLTTPKGWGVLDQILHDDADDQLRLPFEGNEGP